MDGASEPPSIARVSRADGAGIRVHIPGGAEVVALRAVRICGDMRLNIGAAASRLLKKSFCGAVGV